MAKKTTIENSNLSRRLKNHLYKIGLRETDTPMGVAMLSKRKLREQMNFGEKSMEELENWLQKKGYKLSR